MLMIWNDYYECYEEKCPACGYSYIPDDRSNVGDIPFCEVEGKDINFMMDTPHMRYGNCKPIHICPKCGTMGIQVG